MTVDRTLKLALGSLFAVTFLWLILREVEITDLSAAFQGAKPTGIFIAVVAFAGGYACRIQRWRLMLQNENHSLAWRSCAGPLMISLAANNILPFRAGDALRCFAFNRALNTTSSVILITILVERLLDLLSVLIFLGLSFFALGVDVGRFATAGSALVLACAAAVLFVLSCPRLSLPALLSLGKLGSRLFPKVSQRASAEVNRAWSTLVHLSRRDIMIRLMLWSLLAWFIEGCVFWLVALALPSITRPTASWLALPVGTLATIVPSTPGYVGTFDYFTAWAMIQVDNAPAAATAYALLVHAVLWLPSTIVGGMLLLLRPSKPSESIQTS